MDIQTPETASFDPADQADFNFVNHALDTLADDRMAEAGAARRKASRALFNAMAPHDDAEAALVALAVAAYHGAMDSFARADEPGASNEIVIRLRSNALAAARSYAATLRLLRKPQSTAGKETARGQTVKSRPQNHTPPPVEPNATPDAEAEAAVDSPPPPPRQQFQPRDKHGQPIPLFRNELMTLAQRRAAYCDPQDADYPAKCAEAIAEETAAIAAQAAAPENPTSPDAEAS